MPHFILSFVKLHKSQEAAYLTLFNQTKYQIKVAEFTSFLNNYMSLLFTHNIYCITSSSNFFFFKTARDIDKNKINKKCKTFQ